MIYEANVNTYGLGEVDFIPTYLLSSNRQMNSTNTNVGGWNSSALRIWLNDALFESFPSDLKAVISTKDTKVTSGNQSNTITTSIDKIWIPCEWEVFGARNYSGSAEDSLHYVYPVFTDQSSRIRTLGPSGANVDWWSSSPGIANSTDFCSVGGTGSYGRPSAGSTRGVLPCFRIAPDT